MLGSLAFTFYATSKIKLAQSSTNEAFENRYGALYLNYSSDHWISRYVVVWSLMRRFAVTAVLIFLMSYPLIQLMCLAVIAVTALIAAVRLMPYKTKTELISQVLGEVVSLLAIALSLCLNYNGSLSVETKYSLGSSIVYTIAFGTAIIALSFLCKTIKDSILLLKGFATYNYIEPNN